MRVFRYGALLPVRSGQPPKLGCTSSSDIEDGKICGIAAEGGAYGDGRTGVCEVIKTYGRELVYLAQELNNW